MNDSLSHKERVVLWAIGACQGLTQLGLLTERQWKTTTTGLAAFDQLDAEWHPESDEIEECVAALVGRGLSKQDQSVMVRLLVLFRDDRESLLERNGELSD